MLQVRIKKKLGSFLLDVEFETGEGVLALLGASGSGKTLTLRCIAGIEKPDEGRIVLGDRVLFDSARGINLRPQARSVGYMFQDYALFPNMTVLDNVMAGMPGGRGGLPLSAGRREERKRREAQARLCLERFHIEELALRRPALLSGGQKQRVAMARLVLQRPELLLLDEPFSALDSYLTWQLLREMKDFLREMGRPALFVTHSRDEVFQLADRVCCVTSGKSGDVLPRKRFFDNPGTRAAAVLSGCKNISPVKRCGERHILATDWGVVFALPGKVPPETAYVGIRAHAFSPTRSGEEGQSELRVLAPVWREALFEWTLSFRASEDGGPLEWKTPKGSGAERPTPERLYVSGRDLMLLSE